MSVEVRLEGYDLVCEYGPIDTPVTASHEMAGGAKRPCFHAVEPLPKVVLFHREPVMSIGPLMYAHIAPWPCILQRVNDVVTMAFDREGHIGACHRPPRIPFRPKAVYEYRLMPMRWWDEVTAVDELLLGVAL